MKAATKICGLSKKAFIITVSIVSVVAVGAAIGLGVYFGVFANASTGTTLTVGRVTAESGTALRKRGLSLVKRLGVSDIPQGPNSYNYAEVMGLKFRVVSMSFLPETVGTNVPSISFATPKTIQIGPSEALTNFTESVTVPPGTYIRADVRVLNNFEIKAICRTGTKLVYTSSTGIKVLPVATTTLPSDIGYYAYPFAWPAISKSATTNNTNDHTFATYRTFTLSTNVSSMNVLFDTTHGITCFDGVNSATGQVRPFAHGTTTNAGEPLSNYFPTTAPNFGLQSLPLFVYLGPNAAQVQAQTWIASATQASIQAATLDPSAVFVFTIVFQPDGSFLSASARDSDQGSSGLENMFSLVSETSTTVTLNSLGFYAAGQTFVKNRVLNNFPKGKPIGSTIYTLTVTDGSDCGKSGFVDSGNNNRAKACSSSTVTTYWKRIK